MKKETATQRLEPSLFDEEYMAPAPAPAPAVDPVLDAEPAFAAEPLEQPVAEEQVPRRPLKPVLLGGAAVLIAGLIGAIAWIGSTAGQHAKKAEPVLAAPEGMSAKALPPPDFSHPPAPEHVPSAIPLPPHAEGGTPEAPPASGPAAAQAADVPPAALAGAAAVAAGAAIAATQPAEAPAASRSAPVVRDEVRVARRAKAAAAAKTASAKTAAAKRAAKTGVVKKTAKAAVPAKRKAAATKAARKAVPVRCTARNKAAAACRAKSQKTSKA